MSYFLRRQSVRLLYAGLGFLLLTAGTLHADNSSLEASLEVERQLLESEVDRYSNARRVERSALAELDQLERQLDLAIGSAQTIDELWQLHDALSRVREQVVARTQEVATRRALLLAAMERVTELSSVIDRQRRSSLTQSHPLTGLWRLTIEPIDLDGWLSLSIEGTLVTGNYRLDTGQSGSVAGTLSGSQIKLQRFDSQAGFDATLEGVYDPTSDAVRGVWQGTEVSAGISTGTWSTQREETLQADDVLAPELQ